MAVRECPAGIDSVLTAARVQDYLSSYFAAPVRVVALAPLGGGTAADLKGYGYGTPVRVDYERSGIRGSAVLETVAPGPFGHEHMADRAQILFTSHAANNRLPLHVRTLDVGAFRGDGTLASLGDVDEFFILNEFATGDGYFHDLERLRDGGDLRDLDLARADALCDYLVGIHRVRGPNPELYVRRLRELVGHHECIAGILDSYPESVDAGLLQFIEHECVRWRWRLKPLTHRLVQVHGDFHPWNILFQHGVEFAVLDRSRGEWGDAADDVACLTINYLFFALQQRGRLRGPFETLFTRFWQRYVGSSGDSELTRVVAPFFAFRGLVLASPLWYPRLHADVRRRLLHFVGAVLRAGAFDPFRVDDYCDG
jgi:phosphotransferase family enzyme